jgi:hypothetical protein
MNFTLSCGYNSIRVTGTAANNILPGTLRLPLIEEIVVLKPLLFKAVTIRFEPWA